MTRYLQTLTLLAALGATAHGQLSIGGPRPPVPGPFAETEVSGAVGLELKQAWEPGAPYTCRDHSYTNPDNGQVIDKTYCTIRARITNVDVVDWHPRHLIGLARISIVGPTTEYLLQKGAHTSSSPFKDIQCSGHDLGSSTGSCYLVIRP